MINIDISNIRGYIEQKLPTILEYSSIAGFVYVILSSNNHTITATRKADEILENGGSETDVLKAVAPLYIGDVVALGGSIYAGVKSDNIHVARTESALLIADIATRKYDNLDKQIKNFGKKKYDEISSDAHKEEYSKQKESNKIEDAGGTGTLKVYDPIMSREFWTTVSALRAAFGEINKRLRHEQEVSYNELYYQLKLPRGSAGDNLFWYDDDGYVEFRDDFFKLDGDDETPVLYLNYNHNPVDKYTKYMSRNGGHHGY